MVGSTIPNRGPANTPTDPDYEYRGLMADTWDLFRGDTSGWDDRAFYWECIARHGQPVLDVGCGTGRILLDYLERGIEIEGVDLSPEMLSRCRAKAAERSIVPTLYLGDMSTLALPRVYRTILVPSSSFQLLIGPEDARRAMARFFGHLLPGGALVMPFMRLWVAGDPTETDWAQTGEKVRSEDGALVRRWSRAHYDPTGPIEHTQDRYEVTRDGHVLAEETHTRSPATRGYSLPEARALYETAGFEGVSAYREFSWEAAGPNDSIFTVVGVRPG